MTVADELRRAGLLDAVGDASVLISLQVNTPSTANASHYAHIVEEHALLRRLVVVAGEIAELGFSLPEDVSEVVDRAEAMVFEVAQRRVVDTMAPLRELLAASLDHLESLFERGDTITGVPTGYGDLDERLAGLQKSNLVVVGARPAMGKTSFALGIAQHAAVHARVPVLVFSLEMSHLELTQRLLCSEAHVDATRMRNGRLLESDWPKISDAIGRLGDAPIYIDDNPNLTVMEIRAKARRLKAREGLGLVVVDYLQLMSGHTKSRAENRQVEVSEISRGLKVLARELDIPVVALSQLSRNLEMRQDKRPVLADLRESGSIEQDADVVLFIYRDEIYNPDSPDRGTAEIIICQAPQRPDRRDAARLCGPLHPLRRHRPGLTRPKPARAASALDRVGGPVPDHGTVQGPGVVETGVVQGLGVQKADVLDVSGHGTGQRDPDPEGGAARAVVRGRVRHDADRATVGMGDGRDDAQAEPDTARGARPGRVGSVERLEDVGVLLEGDARSVIGDLEPCRGRLGAHPDVDGCAFGGVHQGVGDQVVDDLAEPIARHPPRARARDPGG